MSLPSTSLIICSRNRPDFLLDTVNSVLSGNAVPNEIVVVDQSQTSHPLLAEINCIRGCEIRYRWSQSAGISVARNIGIQMARYDFLAITDDDVFVERTWFSTLIQALVDAGTRGAVTGRILPAASAVSGGFVPTLREDTTAATYMGRIAEDVFFCVNIALFRSAFNEVGYFDARLGTGSAFHSAEDNDLGFRLLEAGYHIHYVPEAIVYHRAWRSGRDYLPMRWYYGYGQGAFYAKYFNLKDRFMIGRMWADVARHGKRVFRYGLKRSFKQNAADVVYTLGLLCGAFTWLLTQRKMP